MDEHFNDDIIQEFRANGGRVSGMFAGMNLLLLTVTGVKSGLPDTYPLTYTQDGPSYIIAASYGESAKHPAWFTALKTHPEATVEVGADTFDVKAHFATTKEREHLHTTHPELYPAVEEDTKSAPDVPIVILKRG